MTSSRRERACDHLQPPGLSWLLLWFASPTDFGFLSAREICTNASRSNPYDYAKRQKSFLRASTMVYFEKSGRHLARPPFAGTHSRFGLRICSGGKLPMLQCIAHIPWRRDNDHLRAAAQKQQSFQESCTMPKQKMIPALFHQFRDYDSNRATGIGFGKLSQIIEQRCEKFAIGRRQHNQFRARE